MRLIIKAVKEFFKQFFKSFASMLAFVFALFAFIALLAMASSGETTIASTSLDYRYQSGKTESKNKLLVIPIHGMILNERSTDPLSDFFQTQVTYGYTIKDTLKKAQSDGNIKGILLHIDSPGGTVGGAKAIADGVRQYRQATGKPVYAFVSGTAASGSYWAASSAQTIIADAGSSVGSIGVIFGPFKFYDSVTSENAGLLTGGVVTEKGIKTTYITAGRSKDIGNPYRQLTAAEIASLQESVDDVYGVFVDAVAQGRQLEPAVIRTQIGAMIFSEKQAKERKLIDAIGSRDEAEKQLAQKAGIANDDYQMVSLNEASGFWSSLMNSANRFVPPKTVIGGCPLSHVALAYQGDVSLLCR